MPEHFNSKMCGMELLLAAAERSAKSEERAGNPSTSSARYRAATMAWEPSKYVAHTASDRTQSPGRVQRCAHKWNREAASDPVGRIGLEDRCSHGVSIRNANLSSHPKSQAGQAPDPDIRRAHRPAGSFDVAARSVLGVGNAEHATPRGAAPIPRTDPEAELKPPKLSIGSRSGIAVGCTGQRQASAKGRVGSTYMAVRGRASCRPASLQSPRCAICGDVEPRHAVSLGRDS